MVGYSHHTWASIIPIYFAGSSLLLIPEFVDLKLSDVWEFSLFCFEIKKREERDRERKRTNIKLGGEGGRGIMEEFLGEKHDQNAL